MGLFFRNDYADICHPLVLQRLSEAWDAKRVGYGQDSDTKGVADLFKQMAAVPEADVYFLAGGTVANMTVISSLLRPHEAVLAVETGHINVHEAGAIEASGHKVVTLPSEDGKLTPDHVRLLCQLNQGPAMVKPGMVYISQTTECGTVYRWKELQDLYAVCQELNLLLFIDGARLAAGLASPYCDFTLAQMASVCDVFSIGGTKNGAMLGEAVVLTNPALQADFPWLIKNRGALLAKGFIPAMQFQRLLETWEEEQTQEFQETLYFSLGKMADKMGLTLAEGFMNHGLELAYPAESNQIFVHLDEDTFASLTEAGVDFEVEAELSETKICRFVTTYLTDRDEIAELLALLGEA